jgi:hypothetical protein
MSKLHEVLASEQSVQGNFNAVFRESLHVFSDNSKFHGLKKTYTGTDDSVKDNVPDEVINMVTTVPERLAYTGKHFKDALKHVLSKEKTNGSGRAVTTLKIGDVEVEATATELLALEKKLAEMLKMFEHLPTRDAVLNWKQSELGDNIQEADPVVSYRTLNFKDYKTVAPATDKHPAQVVELNSSKQIGYYTTVKYTGAISSVKKAALIDRLKNFTAEVKAARSRANEVDVVESEIPSAVTEYLFNI